jgi:adenosylhomocysteine nucleosidase
MRMIVLTCLALAVVLATPTPSFAAPAPTTQPFDMRPGGAGGGRIKPECTAILSALQTESTLLENSLIRGSEQKIRGIRFVTGNLAGRNVVLGVSGMGKVNAAVVTTLLIEHFAPNEILFSGIAGCLNPKLGLGDIVIAERTVQHDLLTLERNSVLPMEIFSPVDGKKNPEFFPADAYLVRTAQSAAADLKPQDLQAARKDRTPRIVTGLVVTGDQFIGADAKKKELQDRYHADACEMEGAAVAQVCYQFGVPCLVIRSISDLADDAADADVEVFMKAAAHNAATLVKEIVALLNPHPRNSSSPPASRPAALPGPVVQ